MSKFVTAVQVPHPDGSHVGFLPGDAVPEWAVGVVGDHVHDGSKPAPAEPVEDPAEEAAEADPAKESGEPDFTKPAPTKRGRPRKDS